MQDSISQSLAGRVGIVDLLPLTFDEIEEFGHTITNLNEVVFRGSYPEIYKKQRKPSSWYPSYIRTYVDRDVRLIQNIENSLLFNKFLKLCAGRIGQVLNASALSNECGINVRTVNVWLSVLEQSFIIKSLPPFYQNFNKRIVKSPKLYFIDTGLACSLLNISDENELSLSHFRGALVENFIIMEIQKNIFNKGSSEQLYYWRDSNGVEVDLIIDKGSSFIPIEVKSAATYNVDFITNIKKFNQYSSSIYGMIVYDGKMEFTSSEGIDIRNWRNMF